MCCCSRSSRASFRRFSKQVERASVRRSAGDLLWPSAFRSSARLLLVTLIGFPLGLVGLLSLALLYAVGYVVAALLLGRRLVREPRSVYLAFFVGLVILRIVGILPVLGGLVSAAATVYGVGALTIAAWRAARSAPRSDADMIATSSLNPGAGTSVGEGDVSR